MDNFWSTEAVMIINALVFHNLIHYLNRNVLCANTAQQQMKTLRPRYFIIPGVLGAWGGYRVLRLGVSNPNMREKILVFLKKINELPYNLNCIAVEKA